MAKFQFLTLLLALLMSSCYSVKKSVEASPYAKQINWPAPYAPEEAKFYVHNSIEIAAAPEVVWEILLAAETWPAWYEGATDVQVQSNDDGLLTEEAVFSWTTMGLDFTSTIREFEPPYRLSWESEKKSIKGYHAWLIIPTKTGCQLITDESQHGWLTFMEKTFQPQKLERLHDVWLAAIKDKAENQG
ncbi:MAG: SRPBCC domain-containing protein [Bacteroidota bacterium]